MAASPLISRTSYHERTFSLPSKHHPIVDQFDEQLCRLRSSQTASTSSSSSLSHRLSGLKKLYACFEELLILPTIQQTLARDFHAMSSIILDGSLRLIDICGTARDTLLQTKEQVQNIQSVLRRRYSGELTIDNEIVQYLNSRKEVKKSIKNCFREIKKVDKNGETSTMLSMLKDAEALTAEIFKSLLIHIAGSEMQPKRSAWSLVSKLVHQTSNKEEAMSISNFENLDSVLSSLICKKKKNGINLTQVENLRSQMAHLELEIQELDEVLENLFRYLVKTRATLLNVLSN